MGGNRQVDSRHVGMRPCENIFVLLKCALEMLCLAWLQEGTDIRKVSFSLQNLNGL